MKQSSDKTDGAIPDFKGKAVSNKQETAFFL